MATSGTLLAPDLLATNSYWRLHSNVNGYSLPTGSSLATQAFRGRSFRIINSIGPRLLVILSEDGYRCWLDQDDVIDQAEQCPPWKPMLFTSQEITLRLPEVLRQSGVAQRQPNIYLWGGTIGPNLDCSGLIQMAFASQNIWIPRDAYQQEQFCQPIAVTPKSTGMLRPGDLIFFGTPRRCTHVGLYLGEGRYRHSSGRKYGRNGIDIDSLHPRDNHPVACHYRAKLRGAGRVVCCHDGSAWV
ncbi:C40 family peptidase [Synechococcus sp. M16CYN]|uniref:C40 family peptidase n=1 Tax=Synechococcus sp. M16CYN TaxID=3103139 RepID=UPI0030E1AC0A